MSCRSLIPLLNIYHFLTAEESPGTCIYIKAADRDRSVKADFSKSALQNLKTSILTSLWKWLEVVYIISATDWLPGLTLNKLILLGAYEKTIKIYSLFSTILKQKKPPHPKAKCTSLHLYLLLLTQQGISRGHQYCPDQQARHKTILPSPHLSPGNPPWRLPHS